MTKSESENTQRFFDAVKAGDLASDKALLDGNPGLVHARGERGESAVLLAIYYGRESVKELLLSRGVELDIFAAAATGKADRVAELLSGDASLANAYAPDGFTPLGLAAFFGHRSLVDLLLRRAADINAISRNATGYTALTGAVAHGNTEIVATLLAAGANVNHRYGQGYSPLHEAASSGKVEITRLLLDHGADPNAPTDDGQTPLAMALAKGHDEVAALLRRHGAA